MQYAAGSMADREFQVPSGSVLRVEDRRLVTGAALFTDDRPAEDALHLAFVRSPLAHARVTAVETAEAVAMPGIVAVVTAADLDLPAIWSADVLEGMERPVLADGIVRFAGETVAAVVAESRAEALDAAEMVAVDYEPLPAVIDPVRALDPDSPVLFPSVGTNLAGEWELHEGGDPLEGADVVVAARVVNQRVAPSPLEPSAALAVPGDGGLTVYAPIQVPFSLRKRIAQTLGLEREAVRVVATDVGGGFGARNPDYPEVILTAALALQLQGPVRHVETRTETQTNLVHGRAQVQHIEAGARRDGTITGLRIRVVADCGAYPGQNLEVPWGTRHMAPGPYRIPRVSFHAAMVVTNTTPVGAYRGAGRPEATALLERAVDLVARELDLDPVEVRRRNLLPDDVFPYTTPTGAVYDTGRYANALDEALRLAGYDDLRREQATRRDRGDRRLLGIGLSTYVEITATDTTPTSEFASVEVHADGSVTVLAGITPNGQGHETSLAQVAAAALQVPFEAVRVVHSDTDAVSKGQGTWGSRSLQVAGPSVLRGAQEVVEQGRQVAAHLLEVSPQDVRFDHGRFAVAGVPDRAVTWTDVAAEVARPETGDGHRPDDLPERLCGTAESVQDGGTYPFGTHVAAVEVDVETGDARVIRYVAVDDAGRILNPAMAAGQIHGGIAQGIAQALYEEVAFDESGNPMTSNFATYPIPAAPDLPPYETTFTETPTPLNPLGAKGIGEAGAIAAPPAVQNAVVDALAHMGVRHLDMPITPERVWRAIENARAGRTDGVDAVPPIPVGTAGGRSGDRTTETDRGGPV